jgi:hypothetical protein
VGGGVNEYFPPLLDVFSIFKSISILGFSKGLPCVLAVEAIYNDRNF